MKIKLAEERSLKIEIDNRSKALRTSFYIIPTIKINNWEPEYPFAHISFLWWGWSLDVWYLNYV